MKKSHRTVMAFDFGLRQIGVAMGNSLLGTTQPLPILRAKDGLPEWRVLEDLVDTWRPDLLVVGDPIHMDGSDSELSEQASKFARRLHGRLGLEVAMVDERLSSFEAKYNSREQGHRGDFKRQPVDSLAAELILRPWLAENSGG
ncbi:MAG: Holliday junction resolvase RuvX [Gammaproteobacteria bacterium]|nr:Holliday junction resolvase RuvX [Gammaproteobacteria bacterium]